MKKIALVILVIIIYVIFLKYICNISRIESQYSSFRYTVRYGETSWEIARNYVPFDMDIREYIYYIEKDNYIKAGYIYPGQIIILRKYWGGGGK